MDVSQIYCDAQLHSSASSVVNTEINCRNDAPVVILLNCCCLNLFQGKIPYFDTHRECVISGSVWERESQYKQTICVGRQEHKFVVLPTCMLQDDKCMCVCALRYSAPTPNPTRTQPRPRHTDRDRGHTPLSEHSTPPHPAVILASVTQMR